MRQILCFFALSLCILGYGGEFDPKTKELIAAIHEIPFPPGSLNFRFDTEDTPTSYSVRLEYPAGTTGLLEHYEKYFSENVWANSFAEEDKVEGMLDYTKGKANLHVTMVDVGSTIHLAIFYSETMHTFEEFGALVESSASDDAKTLVAKVIETYGGLDSYTDTGKSIMLQDGEEFSALEFNTYFVKSGEFLLEYSDNLIPNNFKTSAVLSKTGETVQGMASYDQSPETYQDIRMGLSAHFGVSHCVSGFVPELLFQLKPDALFNLKDMTKLDDANLDNGISCFRLQGVDFNGDTQIVWIGKEDYLIRKVESSMEKRFLETTTFEPKINVAIPEEKLKFHEPKKP